MSANTATLTQHQQQVLYPQPFIASGSFTTTVDSNILPIDTREITHNVEYKIYTVTGRYADPLNKSVRTVTIEFADDTPAGTVFDLEKSEFTKTRVWFSVHSDINKYSVRVIKGTLSIQQIGNTNQLHIAGACTGDTERTPSGRIHQMVINFDLHN
ncbi:hypothetical protein [Pseudomonas sp.]|uniref:hypothetical protein n=1 Tax=Pseudomonas sp. TaxID=306 RepID=UPI00263A0E1A|nr:hypothetical protein [Pseudomonas sp.]